MKSIGLYGQVGLVPVTDAYSDEEGAAFWTAMITMCGAMEMGGLTADTGDGKQGLTRILREFR